MHHPYRYIYVGDLICCAPLPSWSLLLLQEDSVSLAKHHNSIQYRTYPSRLGTVSHHTQNFETEPHIQVPFGTGVPGKLYLE